MNEIVEVEGYRAVRLAAGALEATFLPELGMVGVSLRHRGEELLGQRNGVRAYAERGSTLGIPFLHPWANRLAGDEFSLDGHWVCLPAETPLVRREENGLPIHGLLAASPHWQLAASGDSNHRAGLIAMLNFGAQPELLELFPVAHMIEVAVTLADDALTIATAVWPTGDRPLPVAFGYHPYLRLPGVPRPRWRVGLPARRRLLTDSHGIPTGATETAPAEERELGDRLFDDGFDQIGAGATFTLAGGGRRVEVRFEKGYPVAQIFAPASDDVICFEPMTAPTNSLRSGRELPVVGPGDRYEASFSIVVLVEEEP